MKTKLSALLLIGFVFLSTLTGCVTAVGYDGPPVYYGYYNGYYGPYYWGPSGVVVFGHPPGWHGRYYHYGPPRPPGPHFHH